MTEVIAAGLVDPLPLIPAAGTVPWRRRKGRLQVAMVHRPRYDDWAWAKGKLEPGEDWPVAAVREAAEETGYVVQLGRPLPASTYPIGSPARLATKQVRYWAAEVAGGTGELLHEIDQVAWLEPPDAVARLDYARDQEQLRALVQADDAGELVTWPLIVVRHAKAMSRSSWSGADPLRPLDERGTARAAALAPLLSAFGVRRLLSSPSTRCMDTLRPYARAQRIPLRSKAGLSEEGFEADPGKAAHHVARMLSRASAAAVCGHGPVLPAMIGAIAAHVAESNDSGAAVDQLADIAANGLAKGEALVLHLVGSGPGARVVAVEQHPPLDG